MVAAGCACGVACFEEARLMRTQEASAMSDSVERNVGANSGDLPPPLPSFASPGGRVFTIEPGAHSSRYDGDPLWSDCWAILFDGKPAGRLYRNLNYGTTADGAPRWQASTRALYWTHASDAPTGIGFDVAAFDDAEDACAAWARSADQILDWSEGREVVGSYGVVRREVEGT